MKFCHIIIMTSVLAALTSCAKSGPGVTVQPGTPKWQAAKEIAYAYDKADSRVDRLSLAKEGIGYGEACINEMPDNPACYYYHAINTGLYYKSKVIGYQKGIKSMIADCTKVIYLDPAYDHGGAYRMLGYIYTELPATSIRDDSVTRDISKAIYYIEQALEIAPDYPENYIALAKAYLKADNKPEALQALANAKELFLKWRGHEDYSYWRKESRKLTKKLQKYTEGL